MATTLFLRRSLNSLIPADAASEEALRSIDMGDTVKAEIVRPRKLWMHRKFFALLQVIFPHQEAYPTLEELREALTIALGYYVEIRCFDGTVQKRAKSISFAKMDQAAFEQFFERAVDAIVTRILPRIDRRDVEREIADILNGRRAA